MGHGFFALFLFLIPVAAAQQQPSLPKGRSLARLETTTVFPDSAEFAKHFGELYRLLHPRDTLTPLVNRLLGEGWKRSKERLLDSATYFKNGLERIEPDFERRIYYKAYREAFSAQELKELKTFLLTPTGKKLIAVLDDLGDLEGKIAAYGRKVVSETTKELRPPRLKMNVDSLKMKRSNDSSFAR